MVYLGVYGGIGFGVRLMGLDCGLSIRVYGEIGCGVRLIGFRLRFI